MNIAVAAVAYNEADIIEKHIKQFGDIPYFLALSSYPWNGTPVEYDGTKEIAEAAGANVIVGYWPTEHDQRNFLLTRLWEYDYVIISDPDEFYTKSDLNTIIETLRNPTDELGRPQKHASFRCPKVHTYWKTTDYRLSPPDTHEPIIAVDPKRVVFYEHRQIRLLTERNPYFIQPPIPVEMHHLSWVKSDAKVYEKINSYSHQNIIRPGWYEDVWQKWEPGSQMEVRPYGSEKSIAIHAPCPSLDA